MVKTVQDADADTFTAIAHPKRRQLLEFLAQEAQSVNQLAGHFEISRPAISQHLKILLDAGLVSEQRQGRERIYKIQPEPLREIDEWLAMYRHLWTARFDRLEAYLQELQTEEERDKDNDDDLKS